MWATHTGKQILILGTLQWVNLNDQSTDRSPYIYKATSVAHGRAKYGTATTKLFRIYMFHSLCLSLFFCRLCVARAQDRFLLLAAEKRWHAACLQCYACQQPLEGETSCFSRDGNIYCKTDYIRYVLRLRYVFYISFVP